MSLRSLLRTALFSFAVVGFAVVLPSAVYAVCVGGTPNGVLEAGEECDDGNTATGDCCDASCEAETGPGSPPCCNTTNAPGAGLGGCNAGAICGGGCFAPSDLCNVGPGSPGCACTTTPVPPATLCPLRPGEYTLTQQAGGTLSVAGLTPFAFPAGGTLTLEVGAGNNSIDCEHPVVVPPGGLATPAFCIPTLVYTVKVAQAAAPNDCGIGILDSNGGGDYDVVEIGDTSDRLSAACPAAWDHGAAGCGFGADKAMRLDLTVGDGTPDACVPGVSLGNSLTSIPVVSTVWTDLSPADPGAPTAGTPCAGNGVYDPGTDILISVLDQILDFTTAGSSTAYSDIDGDGCSFAGAGPVGPQSASGSCISYLQRTVTTAATGPIGSSSGPLFDNSFVVVLPNDIEPTGPGSGAVCVGSSATVTTGTRCIP